MRTGLPACATRIAARLRRGRRRSLAATLPVVLALLLLPEPQAGAPHARAALDPASPLLPYTKTVFANGLTLIVKENHQVPIVAVDVWVGVGAKHEAPEESGVSHFFEHMIFQGTPSRPPGEIAREIEAVGGYTNAATGLDSTHYYVVVPSDALDLALEVQADALLNANFPAQEVEREREVILDELRLQGDTPRRKLFTMAYQAVFQGTPYANDILGTPETLARLQRPTFLRYHERYYAPNNMVVVVVGDVETARVIEKVHALFGEVPPRPVPDLPYFPPPALDRVIRRKAAMDVDQTYFFVGWPGPGLPHPDEPALTVLAYILGEGRSSRLYRDLRETKGLVSGISAGYSSYREIGMFSIVGNGPGRNLKEAVARLQGLVEQVRRDGVTDEEVQRAKVGLRAQLAFSTESNAAVAGMLGHFELLESAGAAARYQQRIEAVSRADVLRVARTYLKPRAYVLVVVHPRGEEPW